MIRPLKRGSDGGWYVSADGEWCFVRDDNGYKPNAADRESGCRNVPPGRRWDIGKKDEYHGFVIVDSARTLGEAVAACDRKQGTR
jgi:hypothetical protein